MNDTIATVTDHLGALMLALCCRVVVDYSTDAIARFFIILRVNFLDVLNIFDKLLIAFLTGLDRKVRHVGLDSLRVGLDKPVDLRKGEEGVQSQTTHVNQQRSAFFLDPDFLFKDANFK